MKAKNVVTIIGLITIIIVTVTCTTGNRSVLEKFKIGESKVLVCPVHILDNQKSSYDTSSSEKIVAFINENKYADASTTQLFPPANNVWERNEAKMLTVSIDLCVEFVKENDFPDDTFILYAEFLKRGQDSRIFGIHYCLLNNKGEIGMRGLVN